jgi:hypothetical protein
MQPSQLKAADFEHYPPLARQLAMENLRNLRELPLALAPLLLQEVSAYDWKFPAERQEIDAQFSYLGSLTPQELRDAMKPFAAIQVSSVVSTIDWITYPQVFSEQLSAALWATGQVEAFRGASIQYVNAYHRLHPPLSPPVPRLTMVIIGQGVKTASFLLFRKLRPYGVYYSAIQPANGRESLMRALSARASAHAIPYGHWYVDGGEPDEPVATGITSMSYGGLKKLRVAVVEKMRTLGRESGGPEGLQKMMQELDPSQFRDAEDATDPVMSRFRLSIFSEGSGTQFYSTTFAEWTAHELLRRAQPVSALIRFAPRQVQRSFDEMILDQNGAAAVDAQGSLMDADMGAFYVWLNQRRLPENEKSVFLCWFEDHAEAVMIGPHGSPGTESHEQVSLDELLRSAV